MSYVLPAQTDIIAWLRADTGLYQDLLAHTTPVTADGQSVGTWADKTTNGRDASPDISANRPIWKQAIYGSKAIVRFNGSNQFLVFANTAFTSLAGAELFVVAKKTGNSDTKGICHISGDGLQSHHRYSDNHIYDGFGSNSRKDCGTGGPDLSTAFRVFNVISVSGEYTLNIDNSQVFTTATNTTSNTVNNNSVGSGSGGSGGVGPMAGDIAELVIYNRKLTSTERTQAFNYFTDDTSWQAAAVPDNHPSIIICA